MIEKISGREWGIRTPGGVNLAGFQNRYIRPTLSTLYLYYNSGANGENRTHTPKPEWDFKSHASTYSATLALFGRFKKDVFLKLEWNYIKKNILCQEF